MCNISIFILSEQDKQKIFSDIKSTSCHVLLGRPFESAMVKDNVIYIDILSQTEDEKACTYTRSIKIDNILNSITEIAIRNSAGIIILEDFDSLLNYHQKYELLHMVNSIRKSEVLNGIKKMLLVSNDKDYLNTESKELVNDLKLFADDFKVLS